MLTSSALESLVIWRRCAPAPLATPDLPANIVEFRGFDSSIVLILRGGIPRPIGDSPESSSQAMLVGTMLVGRLGVLISGNCYNNNNNNNSGSSHDNIDNDDNNSEGQC